jgi:hypothetical protein
MDSFEEIFVSDFKRALGFFVETILSGEIIQKEKTSLELECYEHFQEIRRKIDLHREKLKEKIDNLALDMIEQTNKVEASYVNALKDKQFNVDVKPDDCQSVFMERIKLHSYAFDIALNEYREQLLELKFKIDQLSDIKQCLKENKFKPFIKECPSFGMLNLNDFQPTPFVDSCILMPNKTADFLELCELSPKFNDNKWVLVYRGGEHGFKASNFHYRCDGIENTMTIVKAKRNHAAAHSSIFGGFTSVACDSSGQYKCDPQAFLFSWTNRDNKPCKIRINPNCIDQSIYCHANSGPVFGIGHDIYIANDANKNSHSYSDLCRSYKHERYVKGKNGAKSFLAGSHTFLVSEIEVYARVK